LYLEEPVTVGIIIIVNNSLRAPELLRTAKRAKEIPDIVEFVRGKLGFHPDREQERVLRGGRRGILLCTRQWGKSTVVAAKAVHLAFTSAGSLILVMAPCGRQSGEFMRKAEEFVSRLGIRPRTDGVNDISIVFPNGSRIVGLPENEAKVRGFSNVALLVIDEASRVRDESYRAMRPTLAVGDGHLWMMSTPNGKRGFLYEEWTHGDDAWERIKVTGPDCSRIARGFLVEEQGREGDKWYRQEYLCEFVEREGAVSSQESIDAALQDFETMGP
jgi:terminase large subunit-like protein